MRRMNTWGKRKRKGEKSAKFVEHVSLHSQWMKFGGGGGGGGKWTGHTLLEQPLKMVAVVNYYNTSEA